MTPKARWLAALRLEPLDRLPFWPKLGPAYLQARPSAARPRDLPALHRWIGSDRHEWIAAPYREIRKRTRLDCKNDGQIAVWTYQTPTAVLKAVQHFDRDSQAWHPVEFPIQTGQDLAVMTECFADLGVEFDSARWEETRRQYAEFGSEALVCDVIGESPLMNFVEHLAGVENAHFLLADYPAEVEALFADMHKVLCRIAQIVADKSVADATYMIENTSTTLISPEQYRRYCYPHLLEYARILQAAGKPMILHMCGHLKQLLPMLAELPVQAFEAFTSPPLGNTTLLDGRTACPDKCLIGGTNAMLWLEPAEKIVARIREDLDALPHHRGIAVTSAGMMPPACEPETIRAVREAVAAYPARWSADDGQNQARASHA